MQRAGFEIPFQVPIGAAPGSHTVTMCVTGSGATGCSPPAATATFTVVLVAVTAMDAIFAALGAGEDPATAFRAAGADPTPWLIPVLLVAGVAVVGGGLWWRSRSAHRLP